MALSIDIEKRLGDFHLQVQLDTGDNVLALLGPSGCGKSMTLKCLAGIEKPDRGRIVLNGVTLFDSERRINLPPQKRRVGYLFQQYALFPHMSVQQNIAAGVRQKEGATQRIRAMIHAMHLDGLEQRRPHQLSGGQQQRLALARILVNEPEILLLDEPFSALDSQLRFALEQEVRQVIRRFGKTVVLVSHNREEVFRLSDRVAIMDHGSIDTVGTREEIFSNPTTCNGALMTGCRNLSPIRPAANGHVVALDWRTELAVNWTQEVPFVGIRPHDLQPGNAENAVRCRVLEEIENPFTALLLLQPVAAPDAHPLLWEVDKARWQQLRAEELDICLPADKLLPLR